jgi:predicted DNA repair protein MutK
MAFSLLVLLDDIASVLDDVALMAKVAARKSAAVADDVASMADDVATMTKVAAGKTTGVLGDDLALNAQQVTGVSAERELPVVWAVAKGSLLNKAVLVPAALLISAVAPWLIGPLLMLGGLFLCYEGAEKLLHRLWQRHEGAGAEASRQAMATTADPAAFERAKVRGAIRTDFILSAEIIVITLGAVADAGLVERLAVLASIAVIMTAGVYGLVAGIVKLDDAGLYLSRRPGRVSQSLGAGLLRLAPWLMKTLSVVGTAAMFLVGGGILLHGVPVLAHELEHWTRALGPWGGLAFSVVGGVAGVLAGGIVVAIVQALAHWVRGRRTA